MAVLLDVSLLRTHPEYRRMLLGLTVSNIGSQLSVVAVGLQVYAITGSTLSVGILGLCALVPLVVLGLYGGALVDAYDRRRVALLSAFGLWVVTLVLAAQAWAGVSSVLLLYALVAGQSAAFAISNPARTAIIPRLVEPERLPSANVLQTIQMNVALTGGPLLGALLVATAGYATAYTVDAVLFTGALWALWRLPALPPQVDGDGGRATMRGLRSVLEGLTYLTTRPNVRMTFVVDLIAMIFAMPRVIFPAVGVLYLGGGAATTGMLTAAVAVGAVVAGVFSGGLVGVRRQGRVIVVAICAFGIAVTGFGVVLVTTGGGTPDHVLITALVAALIFLGLAGAADAVSGVFRQTILQSATPDHLRGRLQGVFIVVVAGGPRLGDLVLGTESHLIGEAWTAVVGGLTCVVLLLVVVGIQRRFLAYDARHPEP